jgi:tetratricopeptide (TPR) repeat protein
MDDARVEGVPPGQSTRAAEASPGRSRLLVSAAVLLLTWLGVGLVAVLGSRARPTGGGEELPPPSTGPETKTIDQLRREASAAPRRWEGWLALARAQRQAGDPEGALASLGQASDLEPPGVAVVQELLCAFLEARDREGAAELLLELQELAPEDPLGLGVQGALLLEAGREPAAERVLGRAKGEGERLLGQVRAPLTLRAAGWLQLQRGYPRSAAELLGEALRLGPTAATAGAVRRDLGDAHARVGAGHLAAGRTPEALGSYEAAFAVDPDPRRAYWAAVAALESQGPDQALGWLERAFDVGLRDWRGLSADPRLAPLQGRPGFEALLARMGADGR